MCTMKSSATNYTDEDGNPIPFVYLRHPWMDDIEVKVRVLSSHEDRNPVPFEYLPPSWRVSGSRLVLSVRDLTQLLDSPRNSAF